MNCDIRNILLCKLSTNSRNILSQIINNKNLNKSINSSPLISFDSSNIIFQNQVYNSSTRHILEALESDSIDISKELTGNFSLHSQYIVRNYNLSEKKHIDNFWNDSDYIFGGVSLIYLSNPQKYISLKTFEEDIKSLIKTNQLFDIKFLVYHSINLSDFVIVFKSKYLLPIISFANLLHNFQTINNVHVILGYSSQIEPKFLLKKFLKNDIIPVANISGTLRANIFSLSTRDNIEEILPCHDNIFYTLSKNSLCITSSKVSSYYLVSFLSKYYDTRSKIFNVFEEFNVCVSNNYIYPVDKSNNKTEIENICLMTIKKLSEFLKNKKYNWEKPFIELLNTIICMSQNGVQRNICYVLIDSITLLLKWLNTIEQKNIDLSKWQMTILTFLRAWKELNEQIIESETIFINNIGYLPQIYNFSTSMIEYYNAYLNMVAKYLQEIDCMPDCPETSDSFACLTVPKLCRRIKTIPIIPDDDPPCESILYIELPFTAISNPFLVMTSILHETAHLLTDKLRFRKERVNMFTLCLTCEINCALNICSTDSDLLVYNYLIKYFAASKINPHLLKHLKQLEYNSAIDLLLDPERMSNIIDTYIKSINNNDFIKTSYDRQKLLTNVFEKREDLITGRNPKQIKLKNIVDDLAMLFSECYADAVMVFALKLKIDEYISVFSPEFIYFDFSCLEEDEKACLLAQRILIVVCACEEALGWSFDITSEKKLTVNESSFLDFFNKIKRNFLESSFYKSINEYCYTNFTLNTIKRYITYCFLEISKNNQYDANGLSKDIKNNFDRVARQNLVFDENFYSTIYSNRHQVILKAKQNIK